MLASCPQLANASFFGISTRSARSQKILRALGTPEDEFGRLTFLRRVALVPDGAPLPFKPDIELIDTPPALDDSVPGILCADALIIPLLTEFQGVLALQDMLEYLAATCDKHPTLQINHSAL